VELIHTTFIPSWRPLAAVGHAVALPTVGCRDGNGCPQPANPWVFAPLGCGYGSISRPMGLSMGKILDPAGLWAWVWD
jgi:hypothetical protein